MHGGKVSARSDGPGRGAAFELRLQLAPATVTPEPRRPVLPTSHERVLIVDDNCDAADSLAMLLNLAGHAARAVYTSHEALDLVDSEPLDVILLDIGLPGMDGYEVARRIRARNTSIRIVALTGYAQARDFRRSGEAGFDAHMVKPVDLQVLLNNLRSEPAHAPDVTDSRAV
jgi:CheY-like chemotaxis protein